VLKKIGAVVEEIPFYGYRKFFRELVRTGVEMGATSFRVQIPVNDDRV
jgi:hypothetical protein